MKKTNTTTTAAAETTTTETILTYSANPFCEFDKKTNLQQEHTQEEFDGIKEALKNNFTYARKNNDFDLFNENVDFCNDFNGYYLDFKINEIVSRFKNDRKNLIDFICKNEFMNGFIKIDKDFNFNEKSKFIDFAAIKAKYKNLTDPKYDFALTLFNILCFRFAKNQQEAKTIQKFENVPNTNTNSDFAVFRPSSVSINTIQKALTELLKLMLPDFNLLDFNLLVSKKDVHYIIDSCAKCADNKRLITFAGEKKMEKHLFNLVKSKINDEQFVIKSKNSCAKTIKPEKENKPKKEAEKPSKTKTETKK